MKSLLFALTLFAASQLFSLENANIAGEIVAVKIDKSSHSAIVVMPYGGADLSYPQIVSAHVGAYIGNGRLNNVHNAAGENMNHIGVYEIDVEGLKADLEVGFDSFRASLGYFQSQGFTLLWFFPFWATTELNASYFQELGHNGKNGLGLSLDYSVYSTIKFQLGVDKSFQSMADGKVLKGLSPRVGAGFQYPFTFAMFENN